MSKFKEYVYYGSTALVVLLYTFAGTTKLTPIVSPALHEEMKENFVVYAAETPVRFLKLDPDVYRVLVGTIELLCVAAIVFAKQKFTIFATWLLAVVMVGATLTHVIINDPMQKAMGAIVGLLLLLARLYTVRSVKFKIN